jgi:hypothetical protein
MITITWTEQTTRQLPEGGDRLEQTPGELLLDSLDSETYESSAIATKHAVEDGSTINDHVILEPDIDQFDVVVSGRHSTTLFGAERSSVIIGDREISGVIPPEDSDRPKEVLDGLIRLKKNKQLVSIDGLQIPVEDWIITKVSAPRSIESAGILVASVSIQEYTTVAFEEVDAPSPRVERGRRHRNNGNANQTDKSGDTTSSDARGSQSVLDSITQGAGDVLAGVFG